MNIAVLTLTRDRLAYTEHCFATLWDTAGCDYTHFVLDQGSEDDTPDWLADAFASDLIDGLILEPENIGCCRGWNLLLRELCDPADYDVIVTFDNDCEVITPNTLAVVASLAANHDTILAPRVDGLLHPPQTIHALELGGYPVSETVILGNIFMAIPAHILQDGFRWDERFAVWDGGESVTQWFRGHGGHCGYVEDFHVNHYLTTVGQAEDMPWYAERRRLEGGRAL